MKTTIDCRGRIAIATVIIATIASAPVRAHQSGDAALLRFETAIRHYAQSREQIEQSVGVLESSSDPRRIFDAVAARGEAIRTARRGAKAGEILDSEVGSAFRTLILKALAERGHRVSDLLEQSTEDLPGDTPQPVVNEPFPWARGGAMWPCLLDVLPVIPEPLQYRIVARDLVLIDVDANLVIDILYGVLPPPPPRSHTSFD
jgi:hypothetical protein